MIVVLLIVLLIFAIGGLPSWPWASNFGYGPSGVLGTVLIVLLILFLLGRI